MTAARFAVLLAVSMPVLAAEPPKAELLAAPVAGPVVTIPSRRVATDPGEFFAADSPELNPRLASSCAFMDPYSPNSDSFVLDYMRHFGHRGANASISTGMPAVILRDSSPFGDASTGMMMAFRPDGSAAGCSRASLAFAAGRHYIARKDSKLAQGYLAYQQGDYGAALAHFRDSYDKVGHDAAALMVAQLYLDGLGVPADTAQAVAWLRKVVDARFSPRQRQRFNPQDPGAMTPRAEAALTLARLHLTGQGVPKDARLARKYYELASEAGHVPATNALGLGYLTGFGGDRSPAKAMKYLEEAAEAGYTPAMYELARLHYHGDAGIKPDMPRAGAWLEAAARQGHPGAQLAAARMYDRGETVAPDQQRAIALYREAAGQGVPDAQLALGTYFYTGEVVDRNLAMARKLFNAAALQAQPDAMFNLGVMAMRGEGGPRNLPAAYAWYSLAGKGGHASAEQALQEVRPMMSAADLAKAEEILQPATRSVQ